MIFLITVIGFVHRHGVSKKTGNNYDFWEVFFTYDPDSRFASDVIGQLSDHKICSPDFLKSSGVGQVYDELYYNAAGVVVAGR